jgi:predicted nucleic acid-binding protein
MIGVDTNILLHAFNATSPQNSIAKKTLETLLSQQEQVAFTDIVIFEFIAQATRLNAPGPSPTAKQVVAQLESWLSSPRAEVIRSKPGDFTTFTRLCAESGRTGQHIFDAQVAAICIDNGVTEFVTGDKGFEKFTELRIRNPFAA